MTLAGQISKDRGQPATVRIGVVTTVVPLIVDVQGTLFTRVGIIGGYLPAVGDVVALLGQSAVSADGSSWLALGRVYPPETTDLPGVWTTWAPTLTNLTVGSGTLTARYRQVGKTVDIFFEFTYGAGSAVTGLPRFTVPVTQSPVITTLWPFSVKLHDAGATFGLGFAHHPSASNVDLYYFANTLAFGAIGGGAPWVWANGDQIVVWGTYETV